MAIFITGDLHGDFSRFKKEIFYEQTELAKDDYVIVTGDFGGVWDGSPNERHWLDWLDAKPFTTHNKVKPTFEVETAPALDYAVCKRKLG